MGTRSSRSQSASNPSQEAKLKAASVQREFTRLQKEAELASVSDAISRIEERLVEYPAKIKAYQRRGFVHSRDLEERLEAQKKLWRTAGPELKEALRQQKNRLRANVSATSRLVLRASSGQAAALTSAERSVDTLGEKVDAADRELRTFYGDIDSDLYVIENELRRIEWLLDELEASPEIELRSGENPVSGVQSVWHRDGEDGPEGVLFLTNQRLLFEQKEEVVTKKKFGIFKSESELVQKLWLDIEVGDIASIEDKEEGGFLGIGKDDILELTCSGKASISRARFHLKGQNSADWRAQIKRVKSGDLVSERRDQAATRPTAALTFPSKCPNCLASLPAPHRGATHLTCEFCGSVIGPD